MRWDHRDEFFFFFTNTTELICGRRIVFFLLLGVHNTRLCLLRVRTQIFSSHFDFTTITHTFGPCVSACVCACVSKQTLNIEFFYFSDDNDVFSPLSSVSNLKSFPHHHLYHHTSVVWFTYARGERSSAFRRRRCSSRQLTLIWSLPPPSWYRARTSTYVHTHTRGSRTLSRDEPQ